jgi:hypothetical protein
VYFKRMARTAQAKIVKDEQVFWKNSIEKERIAEEPEIWL